jgi:hypothetical protein
MTDATYYNFPLMRNLAETVQSHAGTAASMAEATEDNWDMLANLGPVYPRDQIMTTLTSLMQGTFRPAILAGGGATAAGLASYSQNVEQTNQDFASTQEVTQGLAGGMHGVG